MLIDKFNDTQKLLGYLDSVKDSYFFRGYSIYERHMCPSLGRDKGFLSNEIILLRDFSKTSEIIDLEIENLHQFLEWGQHYYLPTRLLDWTTNPFVGLYFALGDKNDFKDHTISIAMMSINDPKIQDNWSQIDTILSDLDNLNFTEMDDMTLGDLDGFDIESKVNSPIFERKYKEFLQTGDAILLIKNSTDKPNSRIKSQSGLFTFHKEADKPMPEELFNKIEINLGKVEKERLSNLLKIEFGIDEQSLFLKNELGTTIESKCQLIKKAYSIR